MPVERDDRPRIEYQIVRPDRLLHEGEATSIILITPEGELGVLPGHSSLICALGDGIMRIHHDPDTDGNELDRIVISGGYAEVTGHLVIVLADHARDITDIDPEVVEDTRQNAEDALDELDDDDPRAAIFEHKIEWCDLLLKEYERYG